MSAMSSLELEEEDLMEITEGRMEDNVDHSTELRDLEHVWSVSLLPLGGEEDIWNKNQSQSNVQTVHSSVCRKLLQQLYNTLALLRNLIHQIIERKLTEAPLNWL